MDDEVPSKLPAVRDGTRPYPGMDIALEFFHLTEDPFEVKPDPKFLYWSASHREALTSLYYGIESGLGLLMLIAPPGMGKSTVLGELQKRLRESG